MNDEDKMVIYISHAGRANLFRLRLLVRPFLVIHYEKKLEAFSTVYDRSLQHSDINFFICIHQQILSPGLRSTGIW